MTSHPPVWNLLFKSNVRLSPLTLVAVNELELLLAFLFHLVLSYWSDCLIHMFSLLKHLLVSRKLIRGWEGCSQSGDEGEGPGEDTYGSLKHFYKFHQLADKKQNKNKKRVVCFWSQTYQMVDYPFPGPASSHPHIRSEAIDAQESHG